ncbi:MAG TPA: CHAD domain-containing protein [Vicinamibacterales bacterium]|nr:CHAD domain-containing protein [Vicinamibacterales bacterium]
MTTREPRGRRSLITRHARQLRRFVPAAVEGDDRGVHQARVASRRLREAVPVVAPDACRPKARKTARTIRKLTRALGGVRELDVTLQLIDELCAADDLSRPALQDVRLHVAAERDRRREEMLERLGELNLAKLDRRLADVAEESACVTTEVWRQALAARLSKRARRLTAAVEAAGQLYAAEQLHDVRIAAKKLRYGLELAAEAGITAARPLVRTLKRVQTTLGKLHDLQVLQQHVAAVQLDASARVSAQDGLAAVADRLEARCRVLHGRYVKRIPDLLTVTAAVRADILPHLVRGRTVKMSLPPKRRRAAGAR